MTGITTHVLDTSRGRPAAGVPVVLEHERDGSWVCIGRSVTNDDGRAADLVPSDTPVVVGRYRLTFDAAEYQRKRDAKTFFPSVAIVFDVTNPGEHHHVPLLLSPHGYTTYRGS
jgi:5-hydroxyisourate hydrolase